MASELIVMKPGSEVTILGGLQGIVVAVMIEDSDHVSYKVAWLAGTSLEEKWVMASALVAGDCQVVRVGFGAALNGC